MTSAAIERLDDVLARGATAVKPSSLPGVLSARGDEVRLTYVFAPLGPVGGSTAGVVLTAFDVTAEIQATRAAQQAALLSELSDRMSAASDPDAALRDLTDTIVPALSDLAAVYVLPRADEPTRRGWGSYSATPPEPARPSAMSVGGGRAQHGGAAADAGWAARRCSRPAFGRDARAVHR